MDKFIVVHDPTHQIPPGLIISSADKNRYREVAVLPVDEKMFALSPIGGFAKREFGTGVPLAGMPRAVAPVSIYASRACKRINWIARVESIEGMGGAKHVTGGLNIATDTRQLGVLTCSIDDTGAMRRPQDSPPNDPGERGVWGWTVSGTAGLYVTQDGIIGLAVYGAMPGARLVWAAVSLTT